MHVADVTVMVMLARALGAFELIWPATVAGGLGNMRARKGHYLHPVGADGYHLVPWDPF